MRAAWTTVNGEQPSEATREDMQRIMDGTFDLGKRERRDRASWVDGHAKIPLWTVFDHELTDGARSTLIYVAGRIFGESGRYAISAAEIARHRRRSVREVRRHLAVLVQRGYLELHPTRRGGVSEYRKGPALRAAPFSTRGVADTDDSIVTGDSLVTGDNAGTPPVTPSSSPGDGIGTAPVTVLSSPRDNTVTDHRLGIRLEQTRERTSDASALANLSSCERDPDQGLRSLQAVLADDVIELLPASLMSEFVSKLANGTAREFKSLGLPAPKQTRKLEWAGWRDIAQWCRSKAILDGREPIEVAQALVRSFLRSEKARKQGYPLPFLAQNPAEFWEAA